MSLSTYSEYILYSTPRLLSLLDRNEISPTYGCFDRPYWHYRITKDFPSSVYQQGVLALAGLYSINFLGNRYYGDANLKKLCIAGMEFWSKIQSADGSFSEWFPRERSIVATAFTSYAISQAIILLEGKIEEPKKGIILGALRSAGRWLAGQREHFVANHIAGALAALYNVYLLTGEDFFKEAALKKRRELSSFQDDEGWFYEYGGCDIGYLSVTVDYLAKYYHASGDNEALDMTKMALDFMRYFIQPDGSAGGEYSSRNTAYIMFHGLEILKDKIYSASEILTNLNKMALPDVGTVDDRYFTFFFLPNLIQSQAEISRSSLPFKCEVKFTKFFKIAGLLSTKTSRRHLIIGGRKGGVVKLFSLGDKPHLIFSDTGYFYRDKQSNIFTTQWQNHRTKICFEDRGQVKNFVINTPFCYSRVNSRGSTIKLILLRIYMGLFGWDSRMAMLMDYGLKKILIADRKVADLNLERTIEIGDNFISIVDRISGRGAKKVRALFRSVSFVESLSPTSRYFSREEAIRSDEYLGLESESLIKGNEVLIQRKIDA